MPEMRTYVVERTTRVEVTANDALGAAQIASVAFEHGQDANGRQPADKTPDGVWGYTTSRVKETSLHTDRIR